METLGMYLLQMACWLLGFWIIYILLLRNETFFHVNRAFLLAGLIISMTMPLMPLRYNVQMSAPVETVEVSDLEIEDEYVYEPNSQITAVSTANIISEQQKNNVSKSLFASINYWVLVYFIGIAFFLIRFVWQLFKMFKMSSQNKHYKLGKLQIVELTNNCTPFSFFGKVYISNSLRQTGEFDTVIAHEKVHIEEYHWADLLVMELACTLQWFNPLLHLYRKAVMQNHEYLADSGSIKRGMNYRIYKMVLANQMLGVPVLSIANGFTILNLKKRLTMMNKNRTKSTKSLNILWALPMAAIILIVFAQPNYVMANTAQTTTVENKTNEMSTISEIVETNQRILNEVVETEKIEVIAELNQTTMSEVVEKVEVFEKQMPLESISDNNLNQIVEGDENADLQLAAVDTQEPQDSEIVVDHSYFNGLIVDIKGSPMRGVIVEVKNKDKRTTCDNKGRFGFTDIEANDTLVLMKRKTICVVPVNGRKGLKIKWLKDGYNASEEQELVNVGYGYVKRREFTGFSSGISGEELRKTGQTNILMALQGRIPGLIISSTGLGSASAMIHGPNSIHGDTTPLFVVDGTIIEDVSGVSVYDVEYVEVMKDASIYGARGANGAILITTRKK